MILACGTLEIRSGRIIMKIMPFLSGNIEFCGLQKCDVVQGRTHPEKTLLTEAALVIDDVLISFVM
jgi:hypothetical protein